MDEVEYRLRFRAANKRNTDDIGLAVYHVVDENYYSPEFYKAFMMEVKKEGKAVKAAYRMIVPAMLTMRQLYRKLCYVSCYMTSC